MVSILFTPEIGLKLCLSASTVGYFIKTRYIVFITRVEEFDVLEKPTESLI